MSAESPATPQAKIDAVVQHKGDDLSRLHSVLLERQSDLERAIPRGGPMAEQMIRVLMTTLRGSLVLAQCSRTSILRSAYEAASVGLPIDGVLGHAYLVPFKVKGRWTAQLLIGYRGFAELAYRSGKVVRISASVICEGDDFDYDKGSSSFLRYKMPLSGERGDPLGAFAMAEMVNGSCMPEVLRKEQIEARREASASFSSKPELSPWTTHPGAMWKKTAVRALASLLPQSPEIQRAAAADTLRDEGINPRAALSATIIPDDKELSDAA